MPSPDANTLLQPDWTSGCARNGLNLACTSTVEEPLAALSEDASSLGRQQMTNVHP